MSEVNVALDAMTCDELLAQESIARVAYTTESGPEIAAVEYRRIEGRLVFCAPAESSLARCAPGHVVAVEIDRVDRDMCRGWSVTAVGECHIVENPPKEPCRAWAGHGPTIALGVPDPSLSGRWVGAVERGAEAG